MAWIAVVPPSPRHPHERYQVRYQDGSSARTDLETSSSGPAVTRPPRHGRGRGRAGARPARTAVR
jgi:hypothetical protein